MLAIARRCNFSPALLSHSCPLPREVLSGMSLRFVPRDHVLLLSRLGNGQVLSREILDIESSVSTPSLDTTSIIEDICV